MRLAWTYEEIVLAADLVIGNGLRGLRAHEPRVVELSALLNTAPIHPIEHRSTTFRSPSSIQRKTFDIATRHDEYAGRPTRGNKLDREVLLEFIAEPERMSDLAARIRSTIRTGAVPVIPHDDIDGEEISAHEGRLLVALHLRRERSPKIRREKLAQVKSRNRPIACEVCGFDFAATYGLLGTDYIEVHHVVPLHISGPVDTHLDDLALLCSNCHRMVHRSSPWLTPEELQRRLADSQSADE